jgi:hypothetical protein
MLPAERIAHLSYGRRLLRCGISIPAVTGWGQVRAKKLRPGCVRCSSNNRRNGNQAALTLVPAGDITPSTLSVK